MASSDREVYKAIPAFSPIWPAMFEGCEFLSILDTAQEIKSIGTAAFRGCAHLARIGISQELSRIPKDAFSGCTMLRMEIPQTAVVASSAFERCISMAAV